MNAVRVWAALAVVVLGVSGCASNGRSSDPQEPVTASDMTDADRRSRARLELASAYFSRGQYETALDEVKLSLVAKPENAEALNLRGLIYASLGDPTLAENSFKRALQSRPQDADAAHNFGWFLCQQRRFDDAMAQFDLALSNPHYRGTARTYSARGLCQARAGKWLEAEGSLLRSYELEPNNPGTSLNLAEVLYQRADYVRARSYLARVNGRSDSANPQSLWLAARVEHKLGSLAKTQEFGEQLRIRYPQSPEAALYEKGRFDE